MTKKQCGWIVCSLMLLMLPLTGCNYWNDWTSSGSGSSSSTNTSSNTQTEQPHGQATVNMMERSPFNGRDLNPQFWTSMEAYCKAGPTQLILADLHLAPHQMTRAGFHGEWKAQCYALASTYAGSNWTPVAELVGLYQQRAELNAWWHRYVGAVVQLMQKAPQTTAIIIANDGSDRVGFRLGPAMQANMSSVGGRVVLGRTVHESQY